MSSKEIKLCVTIGGELVEIGKAHLLSNGVFKVVGEDGEAKTVMDDEAAIIDVSDGSYFGRMIDAQLGNLVPKEYLAENLRKKAEQVMNDQTRTMQENLYTAMFKRNQNR